MTHLYYFVPAVLILLATPGPTNTLLWASGAAVGIRRSLALLAGELAGYLSAITAITLVLGPVITAVPVLGRVLALAAAAYICCLVVALWRRPEQAGPTATAITPSQVFLVTLLNPKAFVFAFTILPVGHERIVWHYIILSACILVVGSCWIVFGHLVGTASGPRRTVLLYRLSSAALAVFAGWIALSAFGSS